MADIGIHSEEEFRECFSLFDKDKKGAIDEFNFGGCLRSMALNPTEKETKELFAEVAKDVEGVQKADVDAVLAAGRKYAKVMAAADQEQGLRDALKVLDKEGNGMVSSAELRHIVANLKVKTEKIGDEMVHTPIGDEELDEAMEEIDPKKAGQIKIDHLVKEVFKKVYNRQQPTPTQPKPPTTPTQPKPPTGVHPAARLGLVPRGPAQAPEPLGDDDVSAGYVRASCGGRCVYRFRT